MVDLASAANRTTTQRRVTQNRDTLLPRARQTEADRFQVGADMRQASRGDGGAEELRRSLGLFNSAAAGAAEAFYRGDPEKNAQEASQGALDALAGTPENSKSRAYTTSYQKVIAQSEANQFKAQIDTEVDGWLNEGLDPEEISRRYQDSVSKFVKGSAERITDPAAREVFAGNLIRMTGEIELSTAKRIKEATDTRLVEGALGNLATAIDTSQPWDFEDVVSTMAPAVGPKVAKERAISEIVARATSYDDPAPELIRKVLDSKQKDGKTPSVSGAERAALEDALSQAETREEDRVERRKKAVTDAAIDKIADDVRNGIPTNQEAIIKLRESGEIDGDTMVNLIQFARSAYTNLQEGDPNEEASTTDLVELMTNEKSGDLSWLRDQRKEILRKIAANEYGRGAAGRREGLKVLSQVSSLINQEVNEQEQLARQAASEARQLSNAARAQARAEAAQNRDAAKQLATQYVGLFYQVAGNYNIPQVHALQIANRIRAAGYNAPDAFYAETKKLGWDPNSATTEQGKGGSSGRAPVPSSANRSSTAVNPNAPAKDKIRHDARGQPIQ